MHKDFAVAAIQWPDWSLVKLAGQGAQIIGKLPHAGIYREADITPEVSRADLLATNIVWISTIEHSRPPLADQANVIWEKSIEEVELGLVRSFFTRSQVNERWGRGR